MRSRESFATPHSRVPSAMIGQYTLKPDTHSNRDIGMLSRSMYMKIVSFYHMNLNSVFCVPRLSFY